LDWSAAASRRRLTQPTPTIATRTRIEEELVAGELLDEQFTGSCEPR